MRGERDRGRREPAIARLADAQHGVVTRWQLRALGLSEAAIDRRVRRRSLLRLHPGVYAVGHRRLTRHGFWMAAVLAAGPRAALSHRDAAALHGLVWWSGRRVEVTTPGKARATDRIRVHPRRRLTDADRTVVSGVPVTTVARTLVDLADVLGRERLLHAFSEAERIGTFDLPAVEAALARVAGRPGPGHARVRATLETLARQGVQLTRSELERRLRALVRRHGLPPPELNGYAEGEEVDALWRARRVAVEVDGWAFHRDRRAFTRDREKANRLTLAGWRVLRFTHEHITRRPDAVAAAIRDALG